MSDPQPIRDKAEQSQEGSQSPDTTDFLIKQYLEANGPTRQPHDITRDLLSAYQEMFGDL